ncbi:MAG: EamA family transporter [Leptolyngbyaceae cyanobacterium RM2_2_4]|nr:EamA family transporter [Leptolyngbyaceae cyanobacterium SM1_4_3]NJN89673.1 EamA family transporter [Leptolyngbyaceae cyanobacterium SL_5_14]NJO53147.1 EamA family transporter [Leptolyngbyaceae cyanobacterium RM2_2_4]
MTKNCSEQRSGTVGAALVMLSASGFATLPILGKFAYADGLDLPSTLFWRFAGAAVVLWVWMVWRGNWRLPVPQAIASTLLGAIGFAIQSGLFFAALNYAGAGVTSLLLYTYPAFVTLLGWGLEGDRPSSPQLAALVLAFVGCLLTIDLSGASATPLGLGLAIASGAWYALYLTFSARIIRSVPPVTMTAYLSTGAGFSFISIALLGSGLDFPYNLPSGLTLTGIVLIATVIPIVSIFEGIRRLGTSQAAILSTLEPIVTVLLGIAFLNEVLSIQQILGGLLVISSVIVLRTFPQKRRDS